MSSGECPVIYTNWSGGPMNEYVEAGFAQPLDELYEKTPWKDKILDATIAQEKYNDKLYGVGMINVSVSPGFTIIKISLHSIIWKCQRQCLN